MQTIDRSRTLFVGIDVHKDTHTAVALTPFGEKVFETTIGNEAGDFIALVEKTKMEAEKTGLAPSFGLEDVHSWGERLSSFLVEEGLPVVAVAPVLVDRLRQKATHPEKSDSLDARGVAEVMIRRIDSLPVHTLTDEAKKAKQIKRDFIGKRVVGPRTGAAQESAPCSFAQNAQQPIRGKIQKSFRQESFTILAAIDSKRYG